MDKMEPIPEEKFSGKNLDEVPLLLECNGYGVYEWVPGKNGEGKPEAVCLTMLLTGALDGGQVVLTVKTRAEMNRLVHLLSEYRDKVWPNE